MKLACLAATLLSAAAATALASAAEPAVTATASGSTETPPAAATGNPATGAAQEGSELEEITVTAERRTTTLQKSSVVLDVLKGDDVANIQRAQDLTELTTGLQIGQAGPQPQTYIRGVGDTSSNSLGQNAVPFYVDQIVLPHGSQATPQFFDIDRIEVLKGPQGTLYGRNASGGAINIVTNRPVLNEFSGDFNADLGHYGLYKFDGAANIPLTDTVAARFAFQTVDHGPYLTAGQGDQNTQSGRVRLLWQPDDAISLLLNGDLERINDHSGDYVNLPEQNGNPWAASVQAPTPYPIAGISAYSAYFNPNAAYDSETHYDIWGMSAEFNADLGFATLTVLPSFRDQKGDWIAYPGDYRFAETLNDHQTTVEVRLARDTELLNLIVGGYYYHDGKQVITAAGVFGSPGATDYFAYDEAKAVFTQETVKLLPGLRLIAGIRYTDETINGSVQAGTNFFPYVPFTATAGVTTVAPIGVSRTNYKAGMEYDVAAESMLYSTVSTSFKTGGFDTDLGCGPGYTQWKPEDVKAFELGLRNRFLGDSLQVNAEAFRWFYHNQQVQQVTSDPCGGIAAITYNAGQARIDGGSLDLDWKPTQADSVHVGAEYAAGVYTSFTYPVFAPLAVTGSRCSTTPGAGLTANVDCTGQQLSRLPKWSGSASVQHRFPLPDGSMLVPKFTASLASKRWLDTAYGTNGLASAYSVLGLDLTYDSGSHPYFLTAYVDNLTNQAVYTSGNFVFATSAPNGSNFYVAAINPPRTYGIRGGWNFGK
jgi:iron complex outermembrane recepter protein